MEAVTTQLSTREHIDGASEARTRTHLEQVCSSAQMQRAGQAKVADAVAPRFEKSQSENRLHLFSKIGALFAPAAPPQESETVASLR